MTTIEHHIDLGHNKLRPEKIDNIKKDKKKQAFQNLKDTEDVEKTNENETCEDSLKNNESSKSKDTEKIYNTYNKKGEIEKKERKGKGLNVVG